VFPVARLLHKFALIRCFPWVGVCLAAGCFTDTINKKPVVTIEHNDPSTFARGVPITFKADVVDDQSDTLAWTLTAGTCADGTTPRVQSGGSGDQFFTTLPCAADYRVSVTATDRYFAVGSATYDFHLDDQLPTAVITVPGAAASPASPISVPLFSDLQFSASTSSDPDSGDSIKSVHWNLSPPDCASQQSVCQSTSPGDPCAFEVVKAGADCTLTLTVSDDSGTPSMPAQLTIHVNADQPPCIDETDPPFDVQQIARNPADDLPLKVTRLLDDGDPLPPPPDRPSMASFTWSVRVNNGPFTRLIDPQQQSYSIPHDTFQLGDTVQIRVEAHDRVDRPGELDSCVNAQPQPLVCDPVKMAMPTATMSCKRWVTWTVEMVL